MKIPDERIVQDGKLITSYCPEKAADVAFRLLSCLIGEQEAGAVEKAMGY